MRREQIIGRRQFALEIESNGRQCFQTESNARQDMFSVNIFVLHLILPFRLGGVKTKNANDGQSD